MPDSKQTVTFDGKEYAFDSLPPQAKAQIDNLRVVEAEIVRLENTLGICKTARAAYARLLKMALDKEQSLN